MRLLAWSTCLSWNGRPHFFPTRCRERLQEEMPVEVFQGFMGDIMVILWWYWFSPCSRGAVFHVTFRSFPPGECRLENEHGNGSLRGLVSSDLAEATEVLRWLLSCFPMLAQKYACFQFLSVSTCFNHAKRGFSQLKTCGLGMILDLNQPY